MATRRTAAKTEAVEPVVEEKIEPEVEIEPEVKTEDESEVPPPFETPRVEDEEVLPVVAVIPLPDELTVTTNEYVQFQPHMAVANLITTFDTSGLAGYPVPNADRTTEDK